MNTPSIPMNNVGSLQRLSFRKKVLNQLSLTSEKWVQWILISVLTVGFSGVFYPAVQPKGSTFLSRALTIVESNLVRNESISDAQDQKELMSRIPSNESGTIVVR